MMNGCGIGRRLIQPKVADMRHGRLSTIVLLGALFVGCTGARKPVSQTVANVPPDANPARNVDALGEFRAVWPVGGRVYLASAEPTNNITFTLSVNDQPWTDHCEASVGDVVSVVSIDLIGAGSCSYEVLDVAED